MRLLIGVMISLVVGIGCRMFDIPVPSPPVLPGALLVVAMTLGYSGADRFLSRTARIATTKHMCGGPTGESAVPSRSEQGVVIASARPEVTR